MLTLPNRKAGGRPVGNLVKTAVKYKYFVLLRNTVDYKFRSQFKQSP